MSIDPSYAKLAGIAVATYRTSMVERYRRHGQFWIEDYFDRYIRNEEHFKKTVKYIENNPVKAGLCLEPGDWPYSSAWFRKHNQTSTNHN